MYYGSRNSKKRIFHNPTCRYVKRFDEENALVFNSRDEAMNAGYTPCIYCSIIGRQYTKNRAEITAFCEKHNYNHFMRGGELYVISAGDTAWRICCDRKNNLKYLLHESKCGIHYDRRSRPYEEREYHRQKTPSTSIMGYLMYIQKHDMVDTSRKQKQIVLQEIQKEQAKAKRALGYQIARKSRKYRDHKPRKTSGQQRRNSNQHLRKLETIIANYDFAEAAYLWA